MAPSLATPCVCRFLTYFCLLVGVLLGSDSRAAAQDAVGAISGSVRDSGGNPLAGATVSVAGTSLTTNSDSSGSFQIDSVPSGRQTVTAELAGYASRQRAANVRAGGSQQFDFTLMTSGEADAAASDDDVETITVEGKSLDVGSETFQLEERRDDAVIGDRIGKEIMEKTGGSTAAEVTKTSPGVTVKGGKFVFVRGLGERYSQTLLNGANIPSPEPDKRVVPLDLFPTGILEAINIVKSYSADMPGEFSGGSVQIDTIDVPLEAFVKLSVGLTYRHETSFRDFGTYNGGDYDLFGFDDGTRDLPDEVPKQQLREGSPPRGFDAETIQRVGRAFDNVWEESIVTAPPAHKLSLSFGDRYGNEGSGYLGVVGALTWSNSYQTIEDEKLQIFRNEGTRDDPDVRSFANYDLDSFTRTAVLSAALNLTYEVNEGQKIGARNLFTRSAEDRVRLQEGRDGQQDRDTRVTQLRYVERTLWFSQLFGEHLLKGDLVLDWRGSYALSQRDEPDNRQVRYDDLGSGFVLENVSGSGRRDFYLLDENIYDGGLDLTIPFAPFVDPEVVEPDIEKRAESIRPDQYIKLGVAGTHRDRDFDARRFRFTPTGIVVDENGDRVDLALPPEVLFQPGNISPDGFAVNEVTRTTDNYEAESTLLAAYGLFDLRLVDALRIQAGVRVESSDQQVTTFELFGEDPNEVEAEIDKTDFLPHVNLTWEFVDNMQLRLSGSRTVSRPEFRELAEFEFTDVAGGFAARGNPDLKRARVWNADLRWEWFPLPGDVVSASLFFKRFEDPVEQTVLVTGSQLLRSWENADEADLFGFEFEARKRLDFLTEQLRDFSMLLNFTWIESEVTLSSEQKRADVLTNTERALQGQPDYIFNAGLLYDSKEHGVTATVLANRFGKRINAVGGFGLDDEVEESRWSLDASIQKRFGRSAVKLSATNILNDRFEFTQGGKATRRYRRGFTLGISYSVDF